MPDRRSRGDTHLSVVVCKGVYLERCWNEHSTITPQPCSLRMTWESAAKHLHNHLASFPSPLRRVAAVKLTLQS